jgi:hypothetical protein
MTAREKTILSWLKGVSLPENQGRELAEPTPGEVKALLIKLPAELHRQIVAGPNGRYFQESATQMLTKFAEQEEKAKQAKK